MSLYYSIPSNAGWVFFHVGVLDEALQELRIASAISPSLTDAGLYTGLVLAFDGRFQEAWPFLHGIPESWFSKTLQAFDLWEMGRRDEAWAIVDELIKADPQEKFAPLACLHTLMLAGSGNGSEAERRMKKLVKQMEAPYGHFHHSANFVAEIYAQLNRAEQTTVWLQPQPSRDLVLEPMLGEHRRWSQNGHKTGATLQS
jgi:tetratricopeptide (TPR) repeat protein